MVTLRHLDLKQQSVAGFARQVRPSGLVAAERIRRIRPLFKTRPTGLRQWSAARNPPGCARA